MAAGRDLIGLAIHHQDGRFRLDTPEPHQPIGRGRAQIHDDQVIGLCQHLAALQTVPANRL
jgi:hypothetical protein